MDINFVALMGRMTRDVKQIEVGNANLILLKLATNHGQGDNRKATYHTLMYYPQSESEETYLLKHLLKGVTVHVTGSLANYRDNTGAESTYIRGKSIQVLSFVEEASQQQKPSDEDAVLGQAFAALSDAEPVQRTIAVRAEMPVRHSPAVAEQPKRDSVRAPAVMQREPMPEVQF